MRASDNGHHTIIPLLLEAGAQIDAQDNDGYTALIWASYKGIEAAVRELLKGNPNLDLKTEYRETALDWARKNNYQSIVDLLVDHERSVGSDISLDSEISVGSDISLGSF